MPVTILALIQLANALLYALLIAAVIANRTVAVELLNELSDAFRGRSIDPDVAVLAVSSVFAVLGMLQLTAAIALLALRRVGWTLAMLLAGVSLASQIFSWWFTQTLVPVSMLLPVITVLYLNQAPVRLAFGLGTAAESEELEVGHG